MIIDFLQIVAAIMIVLASVAALILSFKFFYQFIIFPMVGHVQWLRETRRQNEVYRRMFSNIKMTTLDHESIAYIKKCEQELGE